MKSGLPVPRPLSRLAVGTLTAARTPKAMPLALACDAKLIFAPTVRSPMPSLQPLLIR